MIKRNKFIKNSQGFTLVEVLISISLLSLLVAAMGSTIYTISQTQNKITAQLNKIDYQKTTIDFLKSILSQNSDISPKETQKIKKGVFFIGDNQSIRWLGNMPARHGFGGRTYFNLEVQQNNYGSLDLVLKYSPFQSSAAPIWSNENSYVLIKSIKKISINYLNENNGSNEWVSSWPLPIETNVSDSNKTPSVLSLEINSEDFGIWPIIYFRLNQTNVNKSSNKGFSIGGKF